MTDRSMDAKEHPDKKTKPLSYVGCLERASPEEKSASQERNTAQPPPRIWRDWKPIDKFTFVLMVFTGIYACGFIYEMYVTQRAYVVVKATNLTDFEIGKSPKASLIFENEGRTPAYRVREFGTVEIGAYPVSLNTKIKPLPKQVSGELTIFPNAPVGGSATMKGPVSPIRFEQVEHVGNARVAALGTVLYSDYFGLRHYTNFCVLFGAPNWQSEYCPIHNDAN
jgi:hypothetical protein